MISNVLLNKLIEDSSNFCCLCLNESVDFNIQLQDKCLIETKDSTEIDYLDVLHLLFGEEKMEYLSCINKICISCADEALKSYKFIMKAKQNISNIVQTIECFSNAMNNLNVFQDNCKTVFIDLIANEHYYDNNSYDNNISKAFKRFLKIKQNYKLPINNLKCEKCLLNFSQGETLSGDCKFCSAPQKPCKCSYCTRIFDNDELLQEHKVNFHSKMTCTTCGKVYQNRKILIQHEKTHTQSIMCQKCGRIYKTSISFKQHINSNICNQPTRARPNQGTFICDYCGKRYTQKVSLRVHIQYEHLNYKAHECKFCNKKFWAQSRLKIHLFKHTKEKNYLCKICGGKFVTKESLLYHTRNHTGHKPYQCRECGEQFVSASRRKAHYQKTHLKETFPCNICETTFPSKYKLIKHLHNKHLDIQVSQIKSESCNLK